MHPFVPNGFSHPARTSGDVRSDHHAGIWGRGRRIGRDLGFWLAFPPAARSQSTEREKALGRDRLGRGGIRQRFCGPASAEAGGMAADGDGAALDIARLDIVSPEQLAAPALPHVHGAYDSWNAPPAVGGHL